MWVTMWKFEERYYHKEIHKYIKKKRKKKKPLLMANAGGLNLGPQGSTRWYKNVKKN